MRGPTLRSAAVWWQTILSRKRVTSLSFIGVFSGEWLLKFIPNGGTAVFWRSAGITGWVYFSAIALFSLTRRGAEFEFSFAQFLLELHETIHWAGAIFAGVYVGLYSRFAAQWSYLADLYNQLMAACISLGDARVEANETLSSWKAGFIEDAIDLHLACKPMFAFAIHDLLSNRAVREIFVAHTDGGSRRLAELERRIAPIVDEGRV